MSLYELPKFKTPKIKFSKVQRLKIKYSILKLWKNKVFVVLLVISLSVVFGGLAGALTGSYFYSQVKSHLSKLNIELPEFPTIEKIIEKETIVEYQPQTSQEQAIINVVKKNSPAVVSIIVTKDLPIFEQYYEDPFGEFFGPSPFELQIPQYRQKGTEKKQIGGGTGFIISEEGMILTNRHVVLDDEADYTVLTNEGEKFPAKVLAKDPLQDLAILKVQRDKIVDDTGQMRLESFPTVKLGDSDNLQIGQTVIAIGNALGEFQNTVSVGVISGLGRTITASGGNFVETLEDIIQTDAAINRGNSGGPLLNLKGEVVGINTAMSVEGENIGFTIPVNKAKRDIEQVKASGKIIYPFLGIRYVLVTENVQQENNLSVDYGALVLGGDRGEPAVTLGSAAQEAGIKEGDVVLELEGEKITSNNSLAKIIQKYSPGDKVVLKVLINGKEEIIETFLGERSE